MSDTDELPPGTAGLVDSPSGDIVKAAAVTTPFVMRCDGVTPSQHGTTLVTMVIIIEGSRERPTPVLRMTNEQAAMFKVGKVYDVYFAEQSASISTP